MSIYGYIRLNSHRPTPKNLGLREQSRVIRKWSDEKGLEIRKIFRDTESSSASLELPNLKKLISLIEQGKVSVLVVARLDRFTRTIRLNYLNYLQNIKYALFRYQKIWIPKLKLAKRFWKPSL